MSYKDILGWMTFEETYAEAVRNAPQTGARFLEIGAFVGRSAAYMGEQIRDSGKDIEFHTIDLWKCVPDPKTDPEHFALIEKHGSPMQAFVASMREHAPDVHVMAHQLSSEDAAKVMGGEWDFVFIDADHSYDGCRRDIELWLPRVKPGGTIAGDDYSAEVFPGVVQAVWEAFGADVEIRTVNHWSHWVHRVKA